MKRLLTYKPAAQRELANMDRLEANRIVRALEEYAQTGRGNIKALKGVLKGRYRLRTGKWRATFSLSESGSVVVTDIDNRGEAY